MTIHATVARFPSVDNQSEPGGRIADRRKSLGMPATRLAKEAEVSREHLSAVENGHKQPSPEWVRRVELAMDRYARETGQEPSEAEELAPVSSSAAPIRLTFHDVFGVGEIIAEGPADKPDELVAAVAALLAQLRAEGGQ